MQVVLPREMQGHTYAILDHVEGSHWWFVGRRAILDNFLKNIVAEIPGSRSEVRILDVGCGTGGNLEMLSHYGRCEGVDISEKALQFCRKKGMDVHQGMAESLDFDDGSFDLVTALDLVEHLDNDAAGLSEMYRVMKPGGRLLVFVPAFMWLWGVQDDVSHHRIRYTRPQLVSRLEKAGFEVERSTYANIIFFLPILLGRLLIKLTGFKPESENNLVIGGLNGVMGKIFGAERYWLEKSDLPFGASIVAVARKA